MASAAKRAKPPVNTASPSESDSSSETGSDDEVRPTERILNPEIVMQHLKLYKVGFRRRKKEREITKTQSVDLEGTEEKDISQF